MPQFGTALVSVPISLRNSFYIAFVKKEPKPFFRNEMGGFPFWSVNELQSVLPMHVTPHVRRGCSLCVSRGCT